MVYLCSTTYNPAAEHDVHPLDPAIGIDWGLGEAVPELSGKDAAAPSLAEAAASRGPLPTWEACQSYRTSLRAP